MLKFYDNSNLILCVKPTLKISCDHYLKISLCILGILFSFSGTSFSQNINSGLVGFWEFENNYSNSTVNTNDAIAHGNPQFILEPSNLGAHVLEFDGAGDFLTIPHINSYTLGAGAFTIAMKIKYSQEQPYLSTNGYSSLFDKSDTTNCSGSANGIKMLLDYEPTGSEGGVQEEQLSTIQ